MKDLLISRAHTTKSIMMTSHFHNFYEIYYLCEGNMRYIINDEFFEVSKNDVVLIPKGVIHNTSYGNDGTKRLLINFSEKYVSSPNLLAAFQKKVIKLSERDGFEVESIFKKIESEQVRSDSYSELMIIQYITELLVLFSRSDIKNAETKLDGYSQIMQAAVKYINMNYANNISLSELSLEFGFSKSFFSRKFKEITGFGISEYIALVRIKNAERMLSEKKTSITDVAFACGFNDCSYFAATFKKLMGVTPHKFSENATENIHKIL
ncbi:MAG: helix-turn-helix domain-containing protein [Clostridia bacterium]|nr:helix-turn-helix domain-containing protein [Clostridia bacterium]